MNKRHITLIKPNGVIKKQIVKTREPEKDEKEQTAWWTQKELDYICNLCKAIILICLD